MISVVIPTYKRANLLKESIDSVLAQKDFDDYEIIVVDDDPIFDTNTETEQLINSYSTNKLLYYKNKKNLKMVANWNQCFLLSRGKYVTMLHDDDYFHEKFLKAASKVLKGSRLFLAKLNYSYSTEEMKQKFEFNPSFVKSVVKRILNSVFQNIRHKITPESIFHSLFQFSTLTAIYNRIGFLELGGYKEDTFPSCDHYFNYEYVKKYGGIYLNKIVATYRYFNNASFIVGKAFPIQSLELRRQIISDFPKSKLKEKEAEIIYFNYIDNVKKVFNLDVENILSKDYIESKEFKRARKKLKTKQMILKAIRLLI
ncbi:MAG: glycosyltransferase family 2 protein [Clostridia bacterium]|nr:glycosyltransferase family 2 protein [Clostridia bacterium]